LKYEIQDISEITKQNAVKISHKIENVKCSFLMQCEMHFILSLLEVIFGNDLSQLKLLSFGTLSLKY